ncbi:hypothetical protein EJB05_07505, partial [Eragrostis curvula]
MSGNGSRRSRQKIFVHSFLKAEQKIDWVHVTRKNEGGITRMTGKDYDNTRMAGKVWENTRIA